MTTDASTAVTAVLVSLVVLVALYVWTALALGAVFRKSGEQGWQGWVPILNQAVLLRLGGLSPLLLLLYLVPGLGLIAVWVMQTIACHRIGQAFRVGTGMTVLAALLLPVWASVLGFGSARWVGEEEEAGPRRRGVDADALAESGTPTAAAQPAPIEYHDAPIGPSDVPLIGRSTHVAPADPIFSTSPDIVAPPAPAPGRPTPFAPGSTPDPDDVVSGPAASRSQSPVTPPVGGWTPAPRPSEEPAPGASTWAPPQDDEPDVHGPTRRRSTLEDVPAPLPGEYTDEVTGAVPGAPAPLAAVPPAEPAVPATPALMRDAAPREDLPEPWAPDAAAPEYEAFADSSGPVSAIAGAPDAGAPRSARSSVSAQNRLPEIPDDPIEQTIIARRRRTDWSLVPPSGAPVAIGSDVVFLGRRPAADPAFPGAQVIPIDDATVSKTHARLELRDDKWFVVDLDSTNGVVFATLLGTEVQAPPGVEIEAGDRFLLGDAEIRLTRSTE